MANRAQKEDQGMRLTAIRTTDKSWEFAGFAKATSNNVISLKDVDIIFASSSEAGGGLVALGFSELPHGMHELAGIPVFQWDKLAYTPNLQPNTCVSVDHVVLHTSADTLAKFKQQMQDFGLDLRKERTDIYPGVTQLFYRCGTVIEAIVMPGVDRTFLWGLTLVAEDLDKVKEILGADGASKPKNAVQPGRRILTVRPPPSANTNTHMAFMTPHIKSLL